MNTKEKEDVAGIASITAKGGLHLHILSDQQLCWHLPGLLY